MADRIKKFKNFGKDSEELRRRRNDTAVELRKARKDEHLSKKRNIDTDEVDLAEKDSPLNSPEAGSPRVIEATAETFEKIRSDIFSDDPSFKRQLAGVQLARKILSRERHPPIDLVISAGIVPKCVEFLEQKDFTGIAFESAWVLTNIASGTSEQTNAVVSAGAVRPFINLLRSTHQDLMEQAVWALGNIAGDGTYLRDYLIDMGIVPPLVALVQSRFKSAQGSSLLRNVAWTISNLCRSKHPAPPVEATRQCLPALSRLIFSQDNEVIADACWALSYMSDGPNERIEDIVEAGVIPRLIELLQIDAFNVVTPCLRTIGNIVTGTDYQTDAVLQAEALPILAGLLKCPKQNVVKETAWTLSNIAAGSTQQIQSLINAGIIPLIIHVLKSGDFRSQKEALWAVTNITSGGTIDHISVLVHEGAIPALCNLLNVKESKVITVVLDGIENILKAAVDINQLESVACLIEECQGLDKIELLQNHENTVIYSKAYSIIENFFSEDNEDDSHLPSTSNGFQLNTQQMPDGGFNF